MKDEPKKIISLIIPCYNEEESINICYNEVNKVTKKMQKQSFEIIFIDDGSKDKTLSILKELSSKDKRVKYLSFSRNFGKEAGMYAGLKYSKGDYVAIMDVDLQDPPEKLIEMYEIINNENYDCVALYTKSHKGYGFLRKKLTDIWYKLIDKISDFKQMPGARDYRLMSRQMVDAIVSMPEYNRYIKGIFGYVGYNTKWLSYEAPDRVAGTSKYSIRKLISYALEGIIFFSTKPLIISAYVGLLFCLISFIFIIVIIIRTLIYGNPVSGWPSMVCIILFLSGIQLLFLGIIGLYLSKVYTEVKRRPNYIVKETEKGKYEKD